MAKRPPASISADDAGSTPPRSRRQRNARAETGTVSETPPEFATARADEQTTDDTVNVPEPGDAADRANEDLEASNPTEEEIRLRAYHRYLERGGAPGEQFDDWLEAERELRSRKNK